MKNALEKVFEELNIEKSNGLAFENDLDGIGNYQQLFYLQVKEKLGIDAVYFLRDSDGIAKIPLIYFSMMDTYNSEVAAKLHCLSWNTGEAPLLFIVTPTDIKIFNNYKSPRNVDGMLDPKAGLIDTISLVTDLETQRQKLRPYNRSLLESGEYWRTSKERFNISTRIETTLISNLKVMRRRLIHRIRARITEKESINIIAIVHGLLSRSILIKYLEERKDSNGQSVFPNDFYTQFTTNDSTPCTQYSDVLNSKESTYKLFAILEHKFNGDMLPLVENEYEIVAEEDLRELKMFLDGNSDLESQQMVLWPLYNFNIIPIKIISSIYELFFHLSDTDDDDKGTYYTPMHLVSTLLDEVYPWEGAFEPVSIIDPSCGSGIFLVEAYRRIVCRWMQTNNNFKISNGQLTELLEHSIYGVDINEEAIRVASFSLSLALCDFLDPRSIWNELSFPSLINSNLIVSDFFSPSKEFNKKKYDIVIGNPPWQSQLTDLANEYVNENQKVVGDKQIAQAFSLKCSDLCTDSGLICLLMPSKGFLFNRSSKSSQYRKTFFAENNVFTIINFSVYRKFLFDHASGPAAAVIYSPTRSLENGPIFYCTPKPQFTVQDNRKFSIEPSDICQIPLDIALDERIWKIAMWGSPRDLELIDRLQCSYVDLSTFLMERGMKNAEGYNVGNGAKTCDDFLGLPHITTQNFVEFNMCKNQLSIVDFNKFQVATDKNREIYKAPHLIIKQSHRKTHFLSAVLEYDALFNHSFLGIHGEIEYLKYVSLIIGSKLFSYYHLMTNRRWLIERDELEAGDIRKMPIPVPTEQQLIDAVKIYDMIQDTQNINLRDEYAFELYRCQPYEVLLVNDALEYIYSYFNKKGKSMVFDAPTKQMYNLYNETLSEILKNTFGKPIVHESRLFTGDSPLTVLSILLDGKVTESLQFHTETLELQCLLSKLEGMLTEERQSLFIRRNVRIYGTDEIYIIKPTQKKYWNYSSACRDADEIFSDIMKTWRCTNE